MSRTIALSPQAMARLGWQRVHRLLWAHHSGWHLEHCGHPTAVYPWLLSDQHGRVWRSGVLFGGGPDTGYAWRNVRQAVEWFTSHYGAEGIR